MNANLGWVTWLVVILLGTGATFGQESTNFRIETHVLNAGGHPSSGAIGKSSSYRITLDSIGDGFGGGSLSSDSYRLQPGFALSFPPPGEVTGLRFHDNETLEWNREASAGTYNIYRELVTSLPLLEYGTCVDEGLTGQTAAASEEPPSGGAFFYLVTVENGLAEEGTKGFASDGSEREGNVCP